MFYLLFLAIFLRGCILFINISIPLKRRFTCVYKGDQEAQEDQEEEPAEVAAVNHGGRER